MNSKNKNFFLRNHNNNPIGHTWLYALRNNPDGDMPEFNLSEREERTRKLFELLYQMDRGNVIDS